MDRSTFMLKQSKKGMTLKAKVLDSYKNVASYQ